MSMEHLGDHIRARRTALGLTQGELANMVGVQQSYISSLESGSRKRPSYEVLERLANSLDCTPADLTGGGREQPADWLWKARFSGMSAGELVRFRRITLEQRAQWIANEAVKALGREETLAISGLRPEQLDELLRGPIQLQEDQANKLEKLRVPPNFLVTGEPGPVDDDLRILLTSPDASLWLKFIKRCHAESILPTTLEHLLNAAIETRKTR